MEKHQKMSLYNQLRQTKMVWVIIMLIGIIAILPLVNADGYNDEYNLTQWDSIYNVYGLSQSFNVSANITFIGVNMSLYTIGTFTTRLGFVLKEANSTTKYPIGDMLSYGSIGFSDLTDTAANYSIPMTSYLLVQGRNYTLYLNSTATGNINQEYYRVGKNPAAKPNQICGTSHNPWTSWTTHFGSLQFKLMNDTSIYNPPATATITLNSPITGKALSDVGTNFTASFNITSISNYTWINATYRVWKEDVAFNTTNINLGRNVSNLTSSLYIDYFVIGNYKWIVEGTYGNNTYINTISTIGNFTFVVGASLQSLNYNASTFETSRETFRANFTMLPNSQISSIQFIYNGTNYSVTSFTTTSNSIYLTKSIDIPLNINGFANESKNFYFRFTYAGSSVQESAIYQQNVSFINLQICNATYVMKTLNIIAKNETIPLTKLAAFSLGGNFNYWLGSGSVNKTVLIPTSSAGEFDLCIYPGQQSFKVNADVDYSADGFSQRSYYLRTTTLTNVTNNLTLYLLDNGFSTSIIINVKDKYLTNLKNHFVKILRYYPGLGAYYQVEIAKTDDFGNSLIKAQEEDTDYRIQIENSSGIQIYASNPMRIICTATPCSLNFITGSTEHIVQDLVDFSNVQYSLTWDNNTGYVNFEFSDSTGLTQSMRLLVVQIRNYGEVTICDQVITGTSGISSCLIGANATGEYSARVYRTASPAKYFAQLSISLTNAWQTFGTEGLVWMFMFTIVMFFVGLTVGPAAAGIMTVVSVIFMMATGIIYMPWIVVISIIVVVIIFIIKMRS